MSADLLNYVRENEYKLLKISEMTDQAVALEILRANGFFSVTSAYQAAESVYALVGTPVLREICAAGAFFLSFLYNFGWQTLHKESWSDAHKVESQMTTDLQHFSIAFPKEIYHVFNQIQTDFEASDMYQNMQLDMTNNDAQYGHLSAEEKKLLLFGRFRKGEQLIKEMLAHYIKNGKDKERTLLYIAHLFSADEIRLVAPVFDKLLGVLKL